MESLERMMISVKEKGFINYYGQCLHHQARFLTKSSFFLGMQRFGTAAVPTHTIGLALLQSNWQEAVRLILQQRPGEAPDVAAARNAWLVEGNLNKALELMPRRVVAERCILESFKKMKGDTRNAMGALSTVCIVSFLLFFM